MCKPYILQVEVPEAPEASGLMSARDFDGFGAAEKVGQYFYFFLEIHAVRVTTPFIGLRTPGYQFIMAIYRGCSSII